MEDNTSFVSYDTAVQIPGTCYTLCKVQAVSIVSLPAGGDMCLHVHKNCIALISWEGHNGSKTTSSVSCCVFLIDPKYVFIRAGSVSARCSW